MKRRSWLLLPFALLPLGLAQALSPARPSVSAAVAARGMTVLDTRSSAEFNGWPAAGQRRGGHWPGAINLPAAWLDGLTDAALAALLSAKGIEPTASIALVGEHSAALAARLAALGHPRLTRFDDALADPTRLQALPNYRALVPASWLQDLIAGRPVHAAPSGPWQVFEVDWGAPKTYLLGHVPGAGHIDTNAVESEPLWNVIDPAALRAWIVAQGIRADTTVILYGRTTMAAARVAQILMTAGVADVRLVDGGWAAWRAAGGASQIGLPPKPTPAQEFGGRARPELTVTLEQAQQIQRSGQGRLVSIRSWPEFIGATSGYSYIDAKGDIPGAAWGHGGIDAQSLSDFHNPDGTMRAANEIAAFWRAAGIEPGQRIAFYCGTGWRAAEAFFYAHVMGWTNIAVFDGGWLEWSLDPARPRVSGERAWRR